MTDTAYFVMPPDRPGPGVLLLHSWWGLTPFFRRLADRLADAGFTVLAPDLNVGEVFDDVAAAQEYLAEADPNHLARLVLDSAHLLQERAADRTQPVGVVGFSMGASLALWASVRLPDTIGAVCAFYGTQSIDFSGASARYQLHFAERDPLVAADDAVFMEATIGLENLDLDAHRYPDTGHWFFEDDHPNFDADAAGMAWERMIAFLRGG